MPEALMRRRFAPDAHPCHGMVGLKYRHRLPQWVGGRLDASPPDTVRVMPTRCNPCLSEESGIDTEAIGLSNYADSMAVG
jgi:hypothetical protein